MIGEKIKYLRQQRGISQEELAEILEVSRQSVSKYENETAEPDYAKLAMIAKYFDVSFDYLLGDKSQKETIEETATIINSTNKIAITSNITKTMTSFYKFQIARVAFKKNYNPAAMLIGTDSTSFWGDNMIELAYYRTIEDAEKEIKEIQVAMAAGETTYDLKYNIEVVKKGLFDIQIQE